MHPSAQYVHYQVNLCRLECNGVWFLHLPRNYGINHWDYMDILGYETVFQVILIITLDIHNTRHRIRIRIRGIDKWASVCGWDYVIYMCDGVFAWTVGDAEFWVLWDENLFFCYSIFLLGSSCPGKLGEWEGIALVLFISSLVFIVWAVEWGFALVGMRVVDQIE